MQGLLSFSEFLGLGDGKCHAFGISEVKWLRLGLGVAFLGFCRVRQLLEIFSLNLHRLSFSGRLVDLRSPNERLRSRASCLRRCQIGS